MSENKEYLVRPRLNTLLAQAVKNPLTIVCAGMGCGKTRAVYDFTQECGIPTAWVQLLEADNISLRVWDNFIHAVSKIDKPLAEEYRKIGFPDTEEKINMYFDVRDRGIGSTRYIIVFDDMHLVHDPVVLNFFEQAINNAQETRSIILISREMPGIDTSGLEGKDKVSFITEDDLNFTESEILSLFKRQGLGAEANSMSRIFEDTKGWVFMVNFVTRILKKTPGYAGYAQSAIKQDILQLITHEAWDVLSDRLRKLMLRLSLADHRSAELVGLFAEGDAGLIAELHQQNAFVRYDGHTDSYYIHHLFLEFLRSKQDILTDDEKQAACKTIADWCLKNNFIVDAFFNYEKIGDYDTIAAILFSSTTDFIKSIANHVLGIFDSAPKEIFDRVEYSAAMHIHLTIELDKWQEAQELIRLYEEKYLKLPKDDAFRNRTLGCIYYYQGLLRALLCTTDDSYDFDMSFSKMYGHLKSFPLKPGCWYQHPPSLLTCMVGCSAAASPQKYLNALSRSMQYLTSVADGLGTGLDDLCRGEILYYQGDVAEAELCFIKALDGARKFRQYRIMSRILFYLMRISVYQGDYAKSQMIVKEIDDLLADFPTRYFTNDIILGWYFCAIGLPEKSPGWLKESFKLSSNTNITESAGNYVKTKYHNVAKNYPALLAYLEEKKKNETFLFAMVNALATEALVHFKMNDKKKAADLFAEAYKLAFPNNIVIPFIELGKDMRSFIEALLEEPGCGVPEPWLKTIKNKASVYSKNQALLLSGYKRANELIDRVELSPRELETLHDLYDGLTRSDIAEKYGLSINTVKLHINSIYNKMGARNRADIFRIAAEHDLL